MTAPHPFTQTVPNGNTSSRYGLGVGFGVLDNFLLLNDGRPGFWGNAVGFRAYMVIPFVEGF